jgi:peptidyl-prolyl cis-trans isomerase C
MRISMKMVLSGVCLLAVMVLYVGCQESNAPATGVKTEPKATEKSKKGVEPSKTDSNESGHVVKLKPPTMESTEGVIGSIVIEKRDDKRIVYSVLTVTVAGKNVEISCNPETKVILNGNVVTLSELSVGQQIKAESECQGVIAIVNSVPKSAKDVCVAKTITIIAQGPETKPAAPEAKVVVAEPNAGKVAVEDTGIAATVNGVVIKDADVDVKVDAFMQRAAAQIPPNMVEQYKTRIRDQVVESMVMEQRMGEEIKKKGIDITEEDVNKKLDEIMAAQPAGMTMEMFKNMLAAQGQSLDAVRGQIKKTLGYEKLLGTIEVNDAEAKTFYDENKEDFNTPEQVKASHILVKVAPAATPEEKAAAKAKIDGLLKQAKAGGDFAALAKENSDDPGSKIKGGDLGFFDRGTMVKEFADAAFAMKVGQISNVVETQFGYHIIKVTDRKEGGMTSFANAKADIVKSLQDKKKNELFRQLIEKVKAGAKIEYPPGKEPKPRMPMMPRGGRPGAGAPAPQPQSAPAPK